MFNLHLIGMTDLSRSVDRIMLVAVKAGKLKQGLPNDSH